MFDMKHKFEDALMEFERAGLPLTPAHRKDDTVWRAALQLVIRRQRASTTIIHDVSAFR